MSPRNVHATHGGGPFGSACEPTMTTMADLCVSIVVVLGTAWVVRWVMDRPEPRPLTPVRRRRWVFLSLSAAVVVHVVLAAFGLIAWRSTAVPVSLVGVWLVLCRM